MNLSPQQIIETTRKVLSQDEFQFNPSEKNQFLLRFFEWLVDSGALGTLFYFAIAILGLYICWRVFQAIKSRFSRRDIAKNSIPIAEIKIETSNRVHQITLKDVRALLAKGDNRTAIKILHSFVVDQLDSRKLLSKRKWKTNAHYVAECQKEPRWVPLFQNLSSDFDQAVYGLGEIPTDCLAIHLAEVENKVGQ